MSPAHSGQRDVQHFASLRLAVAALEFCVGVVGRPGSRGTSFLCKYFAGEEEKWLVERMEQSFEQVVQVKPKASRSASAEKYLLGVGLRKAK